MMIAARLVASIFWSLALLFWLILGLVYGVAWCIKEVAREIRIRRSTVHRSGEAPLRR